MTVAHLRLSAEAAERLSTLLAEIAATPGIDPAHRYEVAYCRDQVRERLPAIEGLVIAWVLREAPDRLGLDRAGPDRLPLVGRRAGHALRGRPSVLSRGMTASRAADLVAGVAER